MNRKYDLTLVNFPLNYRGAYGPWLPLNCLALMTALAKEKLRVDFRDYQLAERSRYLDPGGMISFLDDSADLIAISCYCHALPFVIRTAEAVKQASPHKRIILGGLGVRFVAMDVMKQFGCIDVVVTGDSPEILPRLVMVLKETGPADCGHIPGLLYRTENGEVVETAAQRPTAKGYMGQSMVPAFEMLPLHKYETAPVLSAKGCVYKCPFCCIPSVHAAYIQRDLEVVKEEILYLSRHDGPRTFYLIDEAFLHDRPRIYDLLDFTGRNPFPKNTEFKCYGRVNLIDEGLLKDLRKGLFTSLYFGVESGSNAVLEEIRKGFTIEEAVKTIEGCRKHIHTVIASFIYGFPFETFDDFLETMYYIWYLHGRYIRLQFHLLAPLPGTALYDAHRQDLSASPDIASYMSAPYLEPARENMGPVAHLTEAFPHIFPSVYHFKSPRLREKEKIVNDLRSVVFFDESP